MKTCTEQNIEVEREENVTEEWCQIEARGSVMAKMKLVSVWVKRGKTDLESENEKTEKRRMKKDRNPERRE